MVKTNWRYERKFREWLVNWIVHKIRKYNLDENAWFGIPFECDGEKGILKMEIVSERRAIEIIDGKYMQEI